MNKRQRKKRLKQQTNSIQLNNENTKIPEEMKDCVEADENTTKAKQASSVDVEQPKSETKVVASGRQQKKLGNLLRFALFPIIFLFLELVMSCSTKGHFFSHFGIYIALFSVGYGLILQWITTLT